MKHAAEIITLLAFLDRLGWCDAKTIKNAVGISPRKVRAIAEISGKIIGGRLGYKRTDQATGDEIVHEINSLRSRARKMMKRADALSVHLNSGAVNPVAA